MVTGVTELKMERTRFGIKQWRLASLVGISQTELSHYESGRRRCPADLRRKIANVLSTTPDKLFPEEGRS
jgi:transcriptional regulator with XRE-family HTH domain